MDPQARVPGSNGAAPPRTVLVLGGGGLRGCAHLGVLRALDRLAIPVAEIVGVGLGAVIGAARAAGVDADATEALVTRLTTDPALRPDGTRSPQAADGATASLRAALARALPREPAADSVPFFCQALALGSGGVRAFGLPGTAPVALPDAVAAACCPPSGHAPVEIAGERYVDGTAVDPLPLRLAEARRPELVVAVDLASHGRLRSPVPGEGSVAVLQRVLECAADAATEQRLHRAAERDDLVLVRPRVDDVAPFGAADPLELASRAEWDALQALASHPRTRWLCEPDVVKAVDRTIDAPTDFVLVTVDQDACVHCGLCAAVCPTGGYAAVPHGDVVRKLHHYECLRDGACVRACPAAAIRLSE